MKLSIALSALALLMLSSPAMAMTDCHQDMKEMLDGTLEVAKNADGDTPDGSEDGGCTLAALQSEASTPADLRNVH